MPPSPESFSRYLPADPASAAWGWRLIDAGRQAVPPGAPYPASAHPLAYRFGPGGRRTLDEFQIVYLSRGEGLFESASVASCRVCGGTAFLLYPGEWHRYRPRPETGWTEHWIGFDGEEAARVMARFFPPGAAVQPVAQNAALLQVFDQVRHWLAQNAPGREQVVSSYVPLALAFLRAGANRWDSAYQGRAQLVQRAREAMLADLAERTDLEALARRLGCSYSSFRSLFREHTGLAPREYENRIKLNRSRDLLRESGASVTATADALGYSSVYYFSRAFKKQFGLSPKAWMDEQRNLKSPGG